MDESIKNPIFSSPRQIMLLQSFYVWSMRPQFGIGFENSRTSPHNIFFEILSTLGLVGILLFFLPVIVCFGFLCKRQQLSPRTFLFLSFFILIFLQNCFMGSITGNPYLYWLLPLSLRKEI
jgi:O-antigen ligase